MAPFDRSYTTLSYLKLNNILTLKSGLRGYSRSFKLVPFESLDAVSYSPYTVTLTLSCIMSEIK